MSSLIQLGGAEAHTFLDPFRSSLSSFAVEALICTQYWLKRCPNNNEDLQKFMGMESYDEHSKWL
jgi:hypothetical protein